MTLCKHIERAIILLTGVFLDSTNDMKELYQRWKGNEIQMYQLYRYVNTIDKLLFDIRGYIETWKKQCSEKQKVRDTEHE